MKIIKGNVKPKYQDYDKKITTSKQAQILCYEPKQALILFQDLSS